MIPDIKQRCTSLLGFHSWTYRYREKLDDSDRRYTGRFCRRCPARTLDTYAVREVYEYPIYMVTAPFGILVNQLKASGGSIGSGAFFGWDFSSSFSISSALQETYIVKYLVGNRLMSEEFDPDRVPIIIDGTFIVEKRRSQYYNMDGSKRNYSNDKTFIHLPELPEPDHKTTTTFVNFQRPDEETKL